MSIPAERTAIVGATGPTGAHLADHLISRGRQVRVVSRSEENLRRVFGQGPAEIRVADALDAEAVRRGVDGCDLIVDCIGLPADRMEDHPRSARVVADAAASTGARVLLVASYWSYFPHRREVVDEDHPREGGHPWFRFRREAEDILHAAGAAVVHLPDFFGPRVHTSFVQLPLQDAVAGRPMTWMGSAANAREIAFVPDAMEVVARLLDREEAYGKHWAVPGNGVVSGRELARIVGEHLGRPARLRAAPGWLLRLLGLFNADVRNVGPLIPHYVRPARYDTTRLRSFLGEIEMRPLPQAVGETLDWLAAPDER